MAVMIIFNANRDGVVFCPRAHEPEVMKRSETERQKYVTRRKEKCQFKKSKFQKITYLKLFSILK